MKKFIITYEVKSVRGTEETCTCEKEGKNKTEVRKEFEKYNSTTYFPIKSIIEYK
jgi:hypothetical protein